MHSHRELFYLLWHYSPRVCIIRNEKPTTADKGSGHSFPSFSRPVQARIPAKSQQNRGNLLRHRLHAVMGGIQFKARPVVAGGVLPDLFIDALPDRKKFAPCAVDIDLGNHPDQLLVKDKRICKRPFRGEPEAPVGKTAPLQYIIERFPAPGKRRIEINQPRNPLRQPGGNTRYNHRGIAVADEYDPFARCDLIDQVANFGDVAVEGSILRFRQCRGEDGVAASLQQQNDFVPYLTVVVAPVDKNIYRHDYLSNFFRLKESPYILALPFAIFFPLAVLSFSRNTSSGSAP